MLNLKPLSNHIFLETTEVGKTTKSGIYIPETAERDMPVTGKVVAVGPGKTNENGAISPMSVKVGNTVLFKRYGMDEIEVEGKKYLVGDEDSVLAIIS